MVFKKRKIEMPSPEVLKFLEESNKTMQEAAERLHNELKDKGYISFSNQELANRLEILTQVSDNKCYVIIEGFEYHFVLTKEGAIALKKNLERIRESLIERNREYRISMNAVAIKQLDVLIEHIK